MGSNRDATYLQLNDTSGTARSAVHAAKTVVPTQPQQDDPGLPCFEYSVRVRCVLLPFAGGYSIAASNRDEDVFMVQDR